MRISNSVRFGGAVAFGAVIAATAGSILLPENRAVAATVGIARVGRVETPLGTQGSRGAGANVGVIFNLIDDTRRKTDVEVQYGYDKNGDGKITDGTELNADGTPAGFPNEYAPATEDRIDARNTRRNRAPQLFTTAGDIGAIQEYVWKSQQDLRGVRLLTTEYKLTPQGRLVPDPDNPNSFLFATGPNGEQVFAGVQVRVRAFRTTIVKRRAVKAVGAWAYSTPFSLNNNNKPSMTIDSIDSNGVSVPTASDENVVINWTVFDADSEDLDGNNVLDIAKGEDANGNGKLDDERVGVAFDYHRLAANENPATMTPTQIAALSWLPCTRAAGVGDTDSLAAAPGVPLPTSGDLAGLPSAPPGVGRHWKFAWNTVADVGTVYAKFIFRARAFDQKRETGDYVYRTVPLQLDNWRVFNPGSTTFPLAAMDSGRVGHTVTRIQSTVNATDVLDRGDDKGLLGFQSILIAGGSQAIGGGAVNDLDLMAINTITAETSTSSRVGLHLGTARSYHSATALDDGRILFVGGFDATGGTPLATTEVYDPKTQTITSGPSLSTARAKHTAIKLTTGDVAIFGGVGLGGAVLKSCELVRYKPYADEGGVAIAASTWTVASLPDMATRQSQPLAALLPDQTVLVTGGIDANGAAVRVAEILNPINPGPNPATPQIKNPVFVSAPSMLQSRKFGTATSLIDGNVLFSGGTGRKDFEIFNAQNKAFEPVDPTVTMPVVRAQHVAPLLGDGSVLLAGGADDPDAAAPVVTGKADVFKVGARNGAGVWSGSFLQVNGELTSARRLAQAAVVDNGRAFIVGGANAAATFASLETFTPANGSNLAPKARVYLPTLVNSWLYGTPVFYRLTDAELDHAKVEVQYIDRTPTGDRVWRAASPQTTTIGGDSAELTADLATTLSDDQSLVIDPVSHNTTGDHSYIWGTSFDIPRPAVGATVSNGYNMRVSPYGAVRGTSSESSPISILYNTKVVPTIWPFENYADQRPDVAVGAGIPTANQAGDVRIWVHLRDIDNGPGTNGDPASLLFEYAIDKNGDFLIKDTAPDNEFFLPMTPRGAAVGFPTSTNPQLGLQTFYGAPTDSNPTFPAPGAGNVPTQDATHRPSGKGWTYFDWDSVYDIGVPPSSYSNIWVRVTPTDTNNGTQYTGVVQVLHNIKNQAPVLTIIRHPDSVYLVSWQPRFATTTTGAAVTKSSMPTNDPIDFTFNGNIEPASVNSATLPVYRGTTTTSQVRGQYTVVNNIATHSSVVTFWPDPQNLNAGSVVFGQTAASTVLFPNDDYSFRIPGYVFLSGSVPPANPPTGGTTIRPLGGTVPAVTSTYLLVQAVPINSSGTDANYKFHTSNTGVYAEDTIGVALQSSNTLAGSTIARAFGQGATAGLQYTFTRAIDPATLVSPNITTLLSTTSTGNGSRNTNPVVPGQWTLTNTPTNNGTTVTTTALIKFVPLFQMPPSVTLNVAWNAGLRATNGHSVPNATTSYAVETYGRVPNSVVLENFSNTNQRDSTGLPPTAQVTTASWGTEGCVAGTLSGASTGLGLSTPTGFTTDLILPVPATGATTMTLTAPVGNYNNITVGKNCVLTLACPTTSMTLNASGNVTIAGTVGFKGANGWNGVNGQPYYYMFYGAGYSGQVATPAVRAGGVAVNGGGSGGSGPSVPSTNTVYRLAGNNGVNGLGTTVTYGQGGQVATETGSSYTARYLYGAGGGAGGGNGTVGLAGGRDLAFSGMTSAAGYGAASLPGSAANDAFLGSGMTGGGGGGGGGACNYYAQTLYGYLESGGGGAGAGAVSIVCAGTFNLTANGCIDGRGGNGGGSSMECGSGGGGAGGTLKVVSFGNASFDGVIDLRGGRGGAKSFGYDGSQYSYLNVLNDKTCRYGGDGGQGRLLVIAPNYGNTDDVRVYGQMMVRQIATLPNPAGGYVAPPATLTSGTATANPFTGGVVNGVYTFPTSTTEVDWTTLNIASGSIIDLNFGATAPGTGLAWQPVKIFVQTAATIAGTLRINADSSTMLANGSTAPTAAQTVQNFLGRALYPGGQSYMSGSNPTGPALAAAILGMAGSMGGGDGGRGCVNGTNATGHEAGNGFGPSPGVHNMNANTGYFYSSWYQYIGDTGGSGGANSTDGEDGWAPFGAFAEYNYLGAFNDSTTSGLADQRGGGVSGQTAITASPKRLGSQTTDVTTIALANLSSFVGSGGGGGNSGGEGSPASLYTALLGSGGGGAGALAIVSPVSVTISTSGTISARGGDGQTPGIGIYSGTLLYMHAGGGGGSGGTVYIVSDVVNIAPVTNAGGTDGATFDMRGGLGGGRRCQNQFANDMAYPEYMSVGSFGGNGGYGRLVIDSKTSINSGKVLNNRWGMEQTVVDASSNTFKALAGTARFYCPGMNASGSGNPLTAIGRSKWYDLKSISPIFSTFGPAKVANVQTSTLRIEGAQSHPNALGSPAGTWGAGYAANTGDPDPANTSGLFSSVANPLMTGWRFMRFDYTFTRSTSLTGAPVAVDDMTATYTSDL